MSYQNAGNNARWYAVKTRPKQENRAESNLVAWNIETLSPKVRERCKHPYLDTSIYVTKPLFPGYLFARFDADTLLHKIWFTRGVQSVVSFGGEVTPIEDEIIEFIQAQVNEEGFVNIGEPLQMGDKVRITDGPLKSLVGIFEHELKDSERVMILLETVSYQGRLVVARDHVTKDWMAA